MHCRCLIIAHENGRMPDLESAPRWYAAYARLRREAAPRSPLALQPAAPPRRRMPDGRDGGGLRVAADAVSTKSSDISTAAAGSAPTKKNATSAPATASKPPAAVISAMIAAGAETATHAFQTRPCA